MSKCGEKDKTINFYLILALGTLWWTLASPSLASAQSLGAIGGIGGISGEANEATPLFTMTGTPSFREGEGSVSLGYLNTQITRFFGDNIEGRIGPNTLVKINSKILVLSYGVTDRLSIGTVLSLDTSRIRQDAIDAGGNPVILDSRASGASNPSFSVKYTAIRNPNISVRGTVRLPSGSDMGSENPETDLDLAYSVSLRGMADLHLNVGYAYTSTGRLKVNPSDEVVANAAIGSVFGENFVLFAELNYRQAGGSLDPKGKSPTQKSLNATPGFRIRFKDKYLLSMAARIAIINDFQLGYDYSYLTLLSYTF